MNCYAVIGLGFGDEGKGLTVNSLAKKSKPEETLVVRYSGGQQAGHTVVDKGIKHVFSNFGSASIQGVPTLWSEYCTFDPVGIMVEYKELQEKGVTPTLYIAPNCPMTTPYEKNISAENMAHGTCGTGVGNTHKREADFHTLTAKDMLYTVPFNIKFAILQNYYKEDVNIKDLARFIEAVEFIRNCSTIHVVKRTNYNVFDIESKISTIIYESSQGLLLDQHFGFFPHVTRSDLGLKNALAMNRKLLASDGSIELYLITRAYQTRHGNGPMTNRDLLHNIESNVHETNVDNEFQGKFRRSLLDVDLLKYAIASDEHIATRISFANLVLTHLDLVEDAWTYTEGDSVCICNYETEFVDDISEALGINKVIKVRSPEGF